MTSDLDFFGMVVHLNFKLEGQDERQKLTDTGRNMLLLGYATRYK